MHVDGIADRGATLRNFGYILITCKVYFMTIISLSDSHYIEKNSFTYNALMA